MRNFYMLFLLSCYTGSVLAADLAFNGALVSVVIVVVLLLTAIVVAAVLILLLWIRWQRQEDKSVQTHTNQPQTSYYLNPISDGDDDEKTIDHYTEVDNTQSTFFRPATQTETETETATETDVDAHNYATLDEVQSSDEEEQRYVDNKVHLKPVFPPVPLKKPIGMGVQQKGPGDIGAEGGSEEGNDQKGGDHSMSELRHALEKRQTGKEGSKEERQRRNAPTPPMKPSKPPPPTEESKEENHLPNTFTPQPPPKKPKKDEPSPSEKKKEGVKEEGQRRNAPDRRNPPAPPTKPGKPTEERKDNSLNPQPPPKPKIDAPSPHPVRGKPKPPIKPKLEEHSELPKKSKPPPPVKPALVSGEKKKEPKPTPPMKPPAIPDCGEAITAQVKPTPGPKPTGMTASDSTSQAPAPIPKRRTRVQQPVGWTGGRKTVESCRVAVEKLGEHVDSLHAENNAGFSQQFESLSTGEEGQLITDGILNQNDDRNRFHNVVPYNSNHPKLELISGQQDCQHDYINASYIDGFSHPKKYIAAQGPVKGTVIDFWRMVWQERVPTIAMITKLKESSVSKCHRYWPETGTEKYGPYQVTLTEQQVLADYVLSTLNLQFTAQANQAPSQHKVLHLQFISWPDHDNPSQTSSLLSYLRRLRALHRPKIGPLLIHCSAGVGRSGTLLTIDLALQQAGKEGYVDIPAIVTSLRKQRMKMVQNQDQYRFIHNAVLEQLTCGDTQIPTPDLRRAIEKLKQGTLTEGKLKNGFAIQFDVLEKVTPKPQETNTSVARAHPALNRSMNYLPSDHNRVSLKQETPGYINATFADGYKEKHAFIIAQAPMRETCRDFWKMVHERECGIIVMLSAILENQQEMCVQYWADHRDAQGKMFGEYSTLTTSRQQLDGFTIRKMVVIDIRTGKECRVIQFQVPAWNEDSTCSSSSTLISAIHQIESTHRRSGNKPIVIHGSDTVSRCGVFCSLLNVIDCVKAEGVVDVFQAVKGLRIQKPGSVATLLQYQSLFDLVTLYLNSFETYANFK